MSCCYAIPLMISCANTSLPTLGRVEDTARPGLILHGSPVAMQGKQANSRIVSKTNCPSRSWLGKKSPEDP